MRKNKHTGHYYETDRVEKIIISTIQDGWKSGRENRLQSLFGALFFWLQMENLLDRIEDFRSCTSSSAT